MSSINPNSAHTACGKLSFVNPRIKTHIYLFKKSNSMKLRILYDHKQTFLVEMAGAIKTHVHYTIQCISVKRINRNETITNIKVVKQ